MSEWKDDQLSSVLEIKYGKDHKSLEDGDIPCIGSGGIMRYVNDSLYDKVSILIPRKGSLNNIMYQDNPFWTVDTMFWSIINEEKVNPKFLFYQLTLIDYTNLNVGSAVPSLTVPVINEIDISLPEKDEQNEIAEVLSSLDDKIDLLHRQNQTLEQMAETLFREWFVERRPELVEGEADDGWAEKPLSEYFQLLGGFAFKSKDYLEVGKYKVITIKGVQDGYLDSNSAARLDALPEKIKPYQILNTGDILMSLTGNVGRVCLVDEEDCLLNQRVAKIEPINRKWKAFAYFYFRQNEMIDRLTYLSKGSAQLNLSPVETLAQTEHFPDDSLIDSYCEVVNPFLSKIMTNKTQIRTLTALRDTLLPKLMSGEVRVAMDDDGIEIENLSPQDISHPIGTNPIDE